MSIVAPEREEDAEELDEPDAGVKALVTEPAEIVGVVSNTLKGMVTVASSPDSFPTLIDEDVVLPTIVVPWPPAAQATNAAKTGSIRKHLRKRFIKTSLYHVW
jgi:hypothetical protein